MDEGSLKSAIAGDRVLIGGWCALPTALGAEAMGVAGYDWVCIDTQHGAIDHRGMADMIRALELRGTPAVVRVSWNDPGEIMRALDAGAVGVIVPMVNDATEVQRAVQACLYPPEGFRSWGPARRSLDPSGFTPAGGNDRTLCIPMIETEQAVANIDEMLTVPGLGAVFLGPWDLSLSSSGMLEYVGAKPRDRELIAATIDACTRHRVAAGVACATSQDAVDRVAQGFRLPAIASDLGLLLQGARASLAEVDRLTAS